MNKIIIKMYITSILLVINGNPIKNKPLDGEGNPIKSFWYSEILKFDNLRIVQIKIVSEIKLTVKIPVLLKIFTPIWKLLTWKVYESWKLWSLIRVWKPLS